MSADAAPGRPAPPPAFARRPIRRSDGAGEVRTVWGVATETAIEIGLNGAPFAVMMATPVDLQDLAVGFAVTENIVEDPVAVGAVTVDVVPEGVCVDLAVDAAQVNAHRLRARKLEGRTGCGLCGVESLADLRRGARAASGFRPAAAAIKRAFAALPDRQELNQATRTLHAAAWCSPDGALRLVREDIGRHNALDKLVGALAREAKLGEDGFVVMSSRLSFELVQKCAVAGLPFLATVSAPTTLALDLAAETGVGVACLAGGDVVEFLAGDANA